jgi:hypothetical protein
MADKNVKDGPAVEQVIWVGSEAERTEQSTAATPISQHTAAIPAPTPEPAVLTPAPTPIPAPPPIVEPAPTTTVAIDATVKDQSHVLAQTVISTFTDRLKAEAQKRGGHLSVVDIEELSLEFDRKREALEVVFQQSFEQYVRVRERAAFDHARKFPFDRVIVNTFAGLFDQERIVEDGPRAVTRLVLPGFFMALDKMIGPDAMEEFQARSRVIVERLSDGQESELDWEKIYADPESQKICFDALVTFVPYFEDIKKRLEWFLPLVNGNLASNSDWELSESGFHNLVGEMFSELRDALTDAEARVDLEAQYGGVTCFELDRAFERMDQG